MREEDRLRQFLERSNLTPAPWPTPFAGASMGRVEECLLGLARVLCRWHFSDPIEDRKGRDASLTELGSSFFHLRRILVQSAKEGTLSPELSRYATQLILVLGQWISGLPFFPKLRIATQADVRFGGDRKVEELPIPLPVACHGPTGQVLDLTGRPLSESRNLLKTESGCLLVDHRVPTHGEVVLATFLDGRPVSPGSGLSEILGPLGITAREGGTVPDPILVAERVLADHELGYRLFSDASDAFFILTRLPDRNGNHRAVRFEASPSGLEMIQVAIESNFTSGAGRMEKEEGGILFSLVHEEGQLACSRASLSPLDGDQVSHAIFRGMDLVVNFEEWLEKGLPFDESAARAFDGAKPEEAPAPAAEKPVETSIEKPVPVAESKPEIGKEGLSLEVKEGLCVPSEGRWIFRLDDQGNLKLHPPEASPVGAGTR
ncbi:MAG: hypothetical protein HYU64_04365 [Armatimonadetes bacterium]|nr:hypothetical protein [Armatimonadota bacterium]